MRARLVTCYRHDNVSADSLAGELARRDIRLVRADVSDTDDVSRLVVHNAAAISHVPFAKLALDEWRRIIDTNLTGAYLVAQASLPLLDEGASIVFVGSKAATVGVPLRAHYTASKAGLVGPGRSMAKELGPQGIRVNVVAPGVIDGEATAKLAPERHQYYEDMTSLKPMWWPGAAPAWPRGPGRSVPST